MNHGKKLRTLTGLRKLCQGAVIFGFATSAGGNVLHAVQSYAGSHPVTLTIAVVIAAWIPIIFGLMFEIATRIWFRREAALIMKIIAFVGAVGISGITAWNSYFHQRDAFIQFGDETQANLLPLAIDGLMIIGSVYLIELGFQIRDLEAWIEAGGTKPPKPKSEPVPVKKDREPTKKEKIAALWSQYPEWGVQAIADKTGASYNYVHAVVSELKAAATPEVAIA